MRELSQATSRRFREHSIGEHSTKVTTTATMGMWRAKTCLPKSNSPPSKGALTPALTRGSPQAVQDHACGRGYGRGCGCDCDYGCGCGCGCPGGYRVSATPGLALKGALSWLDDVRPLLPEELVAVTGAIRYCAIPSLGTVPPDASLLFVAVWSNRRNHHFPGHSPCLLFPPNQSWREPLSLSIGH